VHPAAFLCPNCSTPLRLKDRSQLGRDIDCPDCNNPLRIVSDGAELKAVPARAIPEGLPGSTSGNSRTALRLVWGVTMLIGLCVVWIAVRPAPSSPLQPVTGVSDTAVIESPAEPEASAVQPAPATETAVAEALPHAPEIPQQPAPQQPSVPPPAPSADDLPLSVELAPEPPLIDVAAQLSLPIVQYSQSRPVSVRRLLEQVSELSAVSIDLSQVDVDPWRERLDRKVTVELKGTTIKGVLTTILDSVGLTWRDEQGLIVVMPK
jgi:DNA-directed RNA polymerase subunit RPC12/RpoP